MTKAARSKRVNLNDNIVRMIVDSFDPITGKRLARPKTQLMTLDRVSDAVVTQLEIHLGNTLRGTTYRFHNSTRTGRCTVTKIRIGPVNEVPIERARELASFALHAVKEGRNPTAQIRDMVANDEGVRLPRDPHKGELTYEEAIETWLEALKQKRTRDGKKLAKSTIDGYKKKVTNKHVLKKIPLQTPVGQIRISDIQEIKQIATAAGCGEKHVGDLQDHIYWCLSHCRHDMAKIGVVIDPEIFDGEHGGLTSNKPLSKDRFLSVNEYAPLDRLRWLANELEERAHLFESAHVNMCRLFLWCGGIRPATVSTLKRSMLQPMPAQGADDWGIVTAELEIVKTRRDQALPIPPAAWRPLCDFISDAEAQGRNASEYIFELTKMPQWNDAMRTEMKQLGLREIEYRSRRDLWLKHTANDGAVNGREITDLLYKLQNGKVEDPIRTNARWVRRAYRTFLRRLQSDEIKDGCSIVMSHKEGAKTTGDIFYEHGGVMLATNAVLAASAWAQLLEGNIEIPTPDMNAIQEQLAGIVGR